MKRASIITGAAGGIGSALCRAFREAGWFVIGSDRVPPANAGQVDEFVEIDLARVCRDERYHRESLSTLAEVVGERPLKALVNNAALQVVKPAEELSRSDLASSMEVNVMAPLLLIQGLLTRLEAARGSVVNISSIHSRLTKPGFVAYATSKSALSGMTRSLAVDLGGRVRVNAISPAAIDTPMLSAGLAGASANLTAVADHHPIGRIGDTGEVAALALFLTSDAAGFMTGAEIPLDGGIRCRLHDPE